MSEMRVMATGLRFPEGPVAMSDGSVVVVEIETGHVARIAPDGTVTRVADTGGGPNGAAIGPDGKLYVCNNGGFEWSVVDGMTAPGPQPESYIGGRIQRVDLDTGLVEDVYTECDGHPLRGPNDIVFDEHGGFYFTDLGKSRARDVDKAGVYYAQPDGSSIVIVVYGLDHANGIAAAVLGRNNLMTRTELANANDVAASALVGIGRIAIAILTGNGAVLIAILIADNGVTTAILIDGHAIARAMLATTDAVAITILFDRNSRAASNSLGYAETKAHGDYASREDIAHHRVLLLRFSEGSL